MARGLGKVLLVGRRLLRLTRLGWLLSMTRLLLTLLWIARPLALSPAWRLIAITSSRRIVACPSLSVRLAWRTRDFGGKIVGWHEAVHSNNRDLAFDQSFDGFEVLELLPIHK